MPDLNCCNSWFCRHGLLAGALVLLFWCAGTARVFAKTIDLRNQSELADYEVSFCSRPSPDTVKNLPGHAFVAFSSVRGDGKRDFLAIGHTVSSDTGPAAAAWSYIGSPVPGLLKEELYTSIMQRCLQVKVNKAEYEAARSRTKSALEILGVVAEPGGTVFQSYKLGSEDCIAFVIDVARALKSKGLKVSDRAPADLPAGYIGRLIAAN